MDKSVDLDLFVSYKKILICHVQNLARIKKIGNLVSNALRSMALGQTSPSIPPEEPGWLPDEEYVDP